MESKTIQSTESKLYNPGQYVLSGSQNFVMMSNIAQPLAGRVGILKLLPFSYKEALRAQSDLTPDEFTIAGGYPRLYDVNIPPAALSHESAETFDKNA